MPFSLDKSTPLFGKIALFARKMPFFLLFSPVQQPGKNVSITDLQTSGLQLKFNLRSSLFHLWSTKLRGYVYVMSTKYQRFTDPLPLHTLYMYWSLVRIRYICMVPYSKTIKINYLSWNRKSHYFKCIYLFAMNIQTNVKLCTLFTRINISYI